MRKSALATTCLLAALSPLATMGTADAHGSMEAPGSRVYTCFTEGPEHPKSAACKEAVAVGGTQALYDWNGVRIGDAAGRHREIIPDGKLCSAGNEEFKGLDLARADWPATTVTAGADFTFKYKATAQHKGGFELYVTKDGYDPAKPLKWSDLEDKPFATVSQPSVENGSYVIPAKLPSGKSGRHLVYAIWQRSDSPEAFYSCSDVVFGGAKQAVAPKSSAPSSSATPTSSEHAGHEACGGSGTTGSGTDPGVVPAVQVGPRSDGDGSSAFWPILLGSAAVIASGTGGMLFGRRQSSSGHHRLNRK